MAGKTVSSQFFKAEPIEELGVNNEPEFILSAELLEGGNNQLVKTSYNTLKTQMISGSKGEATPTSSPTPYDPVTYPDGLFEKWEVKTAGTYTNFKDASNNPIVVTADDLDGKFVQIWVTNGVSKLEPVDLPENPAKLKEWDPLVDTSLTFPETRTRLNAIYRVKEGQTATSSDVPALGSTKWDYIGDKKIFEISKTESGDHPEYKNFVLAAGQATTDGASNTSTNWINAKITDFAVGDVLNITGFGNNTSIVNGTIPRILFYKSTTATAANLISVINHSSTTQQTFTVPALTVMIWINIDGGTGVGADIPNSPYNSSFKIFKIIAGGDITFLNLAAAKTSDRIETTQITTLETKVTALENNTGNKYFDGLGFPDNSLGGNTDKYFDKQAKMLYIKQNGSWVLSPQYGIKKFAYPSAFTYQPVNIIRQADGRYYPDWKGLFEEKVKADFNTITKYYVDNVNGLNTNNGLTPSTAVKTIAYARDTLGARNIILAAGIYWFDEHFKTFTDNNTTTSPLLVTCRTGFATFINAHKGTQYTWTANGTCYQATRSNVVSVLDLTNKDERGAYKNLTKVTSIALCQSTANSWYTDNVTLYIHTFNSRIPDANIALNFDTQNTYTAGQNVPYVYFENIISYIDNTGSSMFFKNNATTQYNTKVYLKNVFAYGNTRGNGVAVDNIKEAILEGCGGGNVLRDALNYHTSALASGFIPMKVLEINGSGYNTGVGSTEVSSNGSTTHEGITIIRINGYFSTCRGSVIADVNNGAMSLNLGVEAYDTILDNDTSYRINGTGSKIWLLDCIGFSDLPGTKSVTAETGATAYVRKGELDNGTTGDIQPV
ncbi:hypothetical protein [Chryseobacterium proteolyticum]|uniref:hypothetical protein n=1 Tax=Chryseobacterium proteolyticum TaxID=118127 RepID=UPI003982D848